MHQVASHVHIRRGGSIAEVRTFDINDFAEPGVRTEQIAALVDGFDLGASERERLARSIGSLIDEYAKPPKKSNKPKRSPWERFLGAIPAVVESSESYFVFDDPSKHLADQLAVARERGLDFLVASHAVVRELEYEQLAVVAQLRELAVPWRELGDALDVTHSAVQQRATKHAKAQQLDSLKSAMAYTVSPDSAAQLVRRGLLDLAAGLRFTRYPSDREFRKQFDTEYRDYDVNYNYESLLRSGLHDLVVSSLIQGWKTGKTAWVFPYDDPLSTDQYLELLSEIYIDDDLESEDDDEILGRAREDLDRSRNWAVAVLEEVRAEGGFPTDPVLLRLEAVRTDV